MQLKIGKRNDVLGELQTQLDKYRIQESTREKETATKHGMRQGNLPDKTKSCVQWNRVTVNYPSHKGRGLSFQIWSSEP